MFVIPNVGTGAGATPAGSEYAFKTVHIAGAGMLDQISADAGRLGGQGLDYAFRIRGAVQKIGKLLTSPVQFIFLFKELLQCIGGTGKMITVGIAKRFFFRRIDAEYFSGAEGALWEIPT